MSEAAVRRRAPQLIIATLLEICPDKIRSYLPQARSGERTFYQTRASASGIWIFEHFGHETVDAAAHIRQEHQDVRAIITIAEGALNRIDLSAKSV